MEDEDVPPLEDMSDLIQKLEALKELKGIKTTKTDEKIKSDPTQSKDASSKTSTVSHSSSSSSAQASSQSSSSSSSSTSSSSSSQNVKQSSNFGGFKKGFLFGGSSKKSSSKQQTTNETCKNQHTTSKKTEQKDDTPYVSAKTTSETLTLPEVQNAMGESVDQVKEKADWVTNDLLEKIQKNKSLAQKLQDPKYVTVINEFQADPQSAMKKYQSSPEVQQFFTEFCGILGSHFENLADSQQNESGDTTKTKPKVQEIQTKDPGGGADMLVRSSTNPHQPTAADESKMQEILSNPEIRDILMDSKIQNLIHILRTDPDKGQRFMMNADDDMKMKIRRLVDCGLLQFQA